MSRDTPRPTCPANLRADGDTDEEFCLLPKGHTGDHRFESVDAPVASGTPKEQERADAALWLSRSSLWLHIPQLANIPSGFGGTMFDAIAALRKEYPGDYPLDKFSPAPVPPVAEAREALRKHVYGEGQVRPSSDFGQPYEELTDALLAAVRAERDREHQALIAAVRRVNESARTYFPVSIDVGAFGAFGEALKALAAFPLPTPTPEK